jgi:predicted kinase/tetratricopeptide (TPR) repeat protein
MLNVNRHTSAMNDGEIAADTLLIFVGHPGDASHESHAIKSLESDFQHLLDVRIDVMRERPFSRVKVWEWQEDAKATPLGQAGLITPYLERAQMAIFVFRQRIGLVTWQELEQCCRVPDPKPVMVIFCQDPHIDRGLHDVNVMKDWLALLEKKQQLAQGWTDPAARPVRPLDNYKDAEDLKRIVLEQFDRDVGSVLKAARSVMVESELTEVRAFRPPTYSGYIERAQLSSNIHAAVESGPIVAVAGLAGSGKSSATALYVRGAQAGRLFKAPLWYEVPRDRNTLQDLLASLEGECKTLQFAGKSPAIQCRQLMAFLADQNAVLVVDNFHLAEQSSFEGLLRAAVSEGTPARVILISNERVRSEEALTGIVHVQCSGFDPADVERYLSTQGINSLGADLTQLLLQKTEALPIAISIFCTLIKSCEVPATALLRGPQETDKQLESWFQRVVEMIHIDDFRLLQGLSVIDEPFGVSLAKAISASRRIAGGEAALERLERSFLVQRQNVDSWKVHQLVAEFAAGELNAEERALVHDAIASYHCAGVELAPGRELTDDEFLALERSGRHYQKAGNTSKAGEVVRAMSKTAKDRGFYEKLKRLCRGQLELDGDAVTWCTYDYCHCCLITGDVAQAWVVLDALVARLPTVDANLRIQLARLYAEVSSAQGRHEQGLETLSRIIATVDVAALHQTVRFQLRSCEIQLLTRLGRYDAAERLCHLYLAEAKTTNNIRNLAIGFTSLGVLEYRDRRYESARENLREAVRLFREIKGARGELRDRRGLSWALFYLSPCLLECGERDSAQTALLEAIRIRAEIDEASVETRDVLESLVTKPFEKGVRSQIAAEIARLNARLGDSAPAVLDPEGSEVVVPDPCLVVLVGASGCGKTTFALRHFKPSEVVSSDACRELIADDPNEQAATGPAFEVLNSIADKRLAFGRLTVIDATSVQTRHRVSLVDLARAHQTPAVAIVLDLTEELCVQRNNTRSRVVPHEAVRKQIASLHSSLDGLRNEGFDSVYVFQQPQAIDRVRVKRKQGRLSTG